MSRPIIICDTEYFSDEGWNGNHNPDLAREIIQIGALKLDAATLDIIDTFEVLVKTTVNPRLSDYIIKLTGITQQQVDAHGLPFPQAYQQFMDFVGEGRFASYGDDWRIFMLTLQLNNMPVVDLPDRINLRGWINQQAPQTVGVNSGRLAEVLGVRDRYKEHTALADCHSIRDALLHLTGQGTQNLFVV